MPWDASQDKFCRELVANFYARVPSDPVLSSVYPKHLNCPIEFLTVFLIQTLGGPPDYTERRPFLALRETHDRFHLTAAHREAWLRHMNAALDELGGHEELRQFFEQASAYLTNQPSTPPTGLWECQHAIEETVTALEAHNPAKAITFAKSCTAQQSWPAIVARFGNSGHPDLIHYARETLNADPTLAQSRGLLHRLQHPELVRILLQHGADPNQLDPLGHPPLYFAGTAGAAEALIQAGADVNARCGVQQVTALHMAARRGNVPVAAVLLDNAADPTLRDKKGHTPLDRAVNCRKHDMIRYLRSRNITM
ncbi:MAG: ankyrin repeat domain-containing protein [Acidobacteriaceae bacterium]|nr:ankyrin repeat domain-containing protein [Acidobacteriaceae bacterium]